MEITNQMIKPKYDFQDNKLTISNYYNKLFRASYILSRAGLGQIICSIYHITKKDSKGKTVLQTYLNKFFKDEIPKFIDSFDKLCLHYDNDSDFDIRKYNLMNGKLPKNIEVNSLTHRIYLGTANIGNLIEASKQRIEHILQMKRPTSYSTDKSIKAWNKMIDDLKEFNNILITFEQSFVNTFREARYLQNQFNRNKKRNNIILYDFFPRNIK
jgi:hypothetical protein